MIKLTTVAFLTLILMTGVILAQNSASNNAALEIISFEWKSYQDKSRPAKLPSFPHSDYPSTTKPPTPGYVEDVDTGVYYRRNRTLENRHISELPRREYSYDVKKAAFNFDLELKNTSVKKIDSFEADFVFFDEYGKEFFRYNLNSKKDIDSGDTAEIKQVIRGADRKEYSTKLTSEILSKMFTARKKVEVSRIVYKDGTEESFK